MNKYSKTISFLLTVSLVTSPLAFARPAKLASRFSKEAAWFNAQSAQRRQGAAEEAVANKNALEALSSVKSQVSATNGTNLLQATSPTTQAQLPTDIDFTSPLYRLVNPRSGDHFYTMSAVERDYATRVGYAYEGVAGHFSLNAVNQTSPLYRLYNPRSGDHFYTLSAAERDSAQGGGYVYEGVTGYLSSSSKDGIAPLYRLVNPRSGDHFYTASAPERDYASRVGYVYEGISGYLSTTPQKFLSGFDYTLTAGPVMLQKSGSTVMVRKNFSPGTQTYSLDIITKLITLTALDGTTSQNDPQRHPSRYLGLFDEMLAIAQEARQAVQNDPVALQNADVTIQRIQIAQEKTVEVFTLLPSGTGVITRLFQADFAQVIDGSNAASACSCTLNISSEVVEGSDVRGFFTYSKAQNPQQYLDAVTRMRDAAVSARDTQADPAKKQEIQQVIDKLEEALSLSVTAGPYTLTKKENIVTVRYKANGVDIYYVLDTRTRLITSNLFYEGWTVEPLTDPGLYLSFFGRMLSDANAARSLLSNDPAALKKVDAIIAFIKEAEGKNADVTTWNVPDFYSIATRLFQEDFVQVAELAFPVRRNTYTLNSRSEVAEVAADRGGRITYSKSQNPADYLKTLTLMRDEAIGARDAQTDPAKKKDIQKVIDRLPQTLI